MLDGMLRRLIDPVSDRFGRSLARLGVDPHPVTLGGLALGLGCAAAIALGMDGIALLLLALNRAADGLDGAIARARGISDRGGFLDITCDFVFYGAVPLAFALRDPEANALPAAVLLAAFYVNGASFLAFSAIAARRRMEALQRGLKSLYYTTGLMEGAETILFFAAFILLPAWYPVLAYVFAALCALTALSRMMLAWRVFGVDDGPK
jgi:phosphatidylglycerophosphate synthase